MEKGLSGLAVVGVERLEERTLLSGNTIATALTVSLSLDTKTQVDPGNTEIGDEASGDHDVDFYKVTLEAGEQILIDVDARNSDSGNPISMLDSAFHIFDTSGNEITYAIESGDPMAGNWSFDPALTFVNPESVQTDFYIGVNGHGNDLYDPVTGTGTASGSTGAYELYLTKSVVPSEPGDDRASALVTTLEEGIEATFSGEIGDGLYGDLDVDFYKVDLQAGDLLQADIDAAENGSMLDSMLRVFDSVGNGDLATSYSGTDPDSGWWDVDPYLEFTAPTTGTYYVGVSSSISGSYDPDIGGSGLNGYTGAYTLELTRTAGTDPDAGTDSYGGSEYGSYEYGGSEYGGSEYDAGMDWYDGVDWCSNDATAYWCTSNDAGGAVENESEGTSDDLTEEQLLKAFNILFGEEEKQLLGYFKEEGGVIRILDGWNPDIFPDNSDFDDAGNNFEIEIAEELDLITAAGELARQLERAAGNPLIRNHFDLNTERGLKRYEKAYKEGFKQGRQAAVIGAELYLSGAQIFNEAADVVISLAEAGNHLAKGELKRSALSLAGLLPLAPGRVVRIVFDRGEHLIVPNAVREFIENGKVGKGFQSHAKLVAELKPAGKNHSWHHLVQEHDGNLARFGKTKIHNEANVIALPNKIHQQITSIQNSIDFDITNSRTKKVYEWIAEKSYEEQHEFGVKLVEYVLTGKWPK